MYVIYCGVLLGLLGTGIKYDLLLDQQVPHIVFGYKTSEEIWSCNPGNYYNLKIFCCVTYAQVKIDKLEHKAIKYILMGYGSGVKGYRLCCTDQDSPGFTIVEM